MDEVGQSRVWSRFPRHGGLVRTPCREWFQVAAGDGGCGGRSARCDAGDLDEIQVLGVAWTDAEVAAEFAAKKPRPDTSLPEPLAHWTFDKLESDFTFKDVTVRGNDGDHNKGLPDGVTWWEVICGKEPNAFVICHSGDCCRHDQFHPVAKHPDIFFGHCAIGLSFPKAYQTTMPAKFMVPLHHQELGHLGGRYRCVGFHEEPARIVRELRALGAKVAMPVWGDRIV